MRRVPVVLALVIAAACSRSPAASAVPTAVVEQTETASAVGSATINDTKGDLTRGDGKRVQKPAYIDVVGASAHVADGRYTVTVTLAGNIPPRPSSLLEELNYVVLLGTNDDTDPSYWLTIYNGEPGDYYAGLDDKTAGYIYDDEEFPGTFTVKNNRVMWSVPLEALGSPDRIRAALLTQSVDPQGGGETDVEDQAPDDHNYAVSERWMTIP